MSNMSSFENDSENSDNQSNASVEKKIFPVYNENNFYITKEIIQSILEKGNIHNKIINLDIWQQSFIHKSYCKNNDFKKNEKFYGSIDSINIENNKDILPLQNDSNEVLEWLGDGIIQSSVAIYLYKRFNPHL